MRPTANTYATIDNLLGPASSRFFGSGFRRVTHDVADAVVDQSAGTMTARATVSYPADWSLKSAGQLLTPHLSTIDAAIISVTLTETYLTHVLDLDEDQRRNMWLSRLVIRAGNTPQEQLADFAISATNVATTAHGDTAMSVFDCRVGGLRTRCEIVHPAGSRRPAPSAVRTPTDLLGDPGSRYYGRGFQTRSHKISNVHLVPDLSEASADIRLIDTHLLPDGLGGLHQPSATVIDGMVVLAQVAQSLLYQLDDIPRGRSNTLWMRHVDVVSAVPGSPLPSPLRTSTAITRTRLIDFDGGRWRTSDWHAQFSDLRFEYRLAHRLPPTSQAEVGR
ncbi:MAG TPA: AvrD family protein [Pseudonocardiaceae bacterium]|jgi:hypothetical protein